MKLHTYSCGTGGRFLLNTFSPRAAADGLLKPGLGIVFILGKGGKGPEREAIVSPENQ